MIEVVDARGVSVRLDEPPRRIVSLVPSTTESLFALGAGEQVVGVTRFCVHPAVRLAGIMRVGGTKDLEVDRLAALAPDLVLGNAEENTTEMFAAVERICPLHVAFPRTVDEALADLATLGLLVGHPQAGAVAALEVAGAWAALPRRAFTYAWLIWRRPWMVAAGDTFITAMLGEAGGVNVFAGHESRYPAVEPARIAAADPDAVLLSSEPFPFRQRHTDELSAATGLPRERFHLVDGELCSWHGVRMAAGFRYLAAQGERWVRP